MAENTKETVLSKNKVQKRHKFRDTVLIRVSRSLKEQIQEDARQRDETLSKTADWALREYLESVKPLED